MVRSHPMSREHVSFPGAQGARLVGRLESPESGEAVAYALFAHCFACSKDLKSSGIISRELLARGIGVLRFDFTGVGESGGDLAETTFSANVEDIVAAADFLRRERRAPALLVGHSLGGAAVLAAASAIPEAAAVATIAAPSNTGHIRHTLLAGAEPTSDCATRKTAAAFTPMRPEGSGRPRVRSTPASSLRSRMSL